MQTFRRYLQHIGQIVGLGVFLYQLWIATAELRLLNGHIDLLAALVAMLISFIGMGIQIYVWKLIMDSLGHSLSLKFIVSGYTLSLLPRYIPGSIWGYFSRNEWLLRYRGIDYKSSNISSLLEISSVFLSALVVISVSVIPAGFFEKLILLSVVVGIIALLPLSSALWFKHRTEKMCNGNVSFGLPTRAWLSFPKAVTMMLFSWVCFGTSLFITVYSFEQSVNINELWGAVYVFSTAWVIGFLVPFLPSGMGAREWIMTSLLAYAFTYLGGYSIVVPIVNRITLFASEFLWLVIGIYVKKCVLR